MAGVAEGPHGGSMGVSGPGTPGMGMGDPGTSSQEGYDWGGGISPSGISNKDFNEAAMEAFKEAINRALGYDKGAQEKDLNALDQIAQENLEAKEKAKEKAQAAKDRSITQGTTHGPQSFGTTELDKISPGYQEAVNAPLAAPAKTSPHDFDAYDPAMIDVGSQVDSFTDYGKLDESQFDDPFNEEELGQVKDDATVFREDEEALMGTTLENIARTDKEKDVSKNRTKNLESAKALMEEFKDLENKIKDLENIPFKERSWAQHTELGKMRTALNEAKNTTRYRTAYATVHGISKLGKAVSLVAGQMLPGVGWWGPKLSQLAIDNGFIDTSTMADIARDIENSVNKAEPMPNALKKFFVEAEPWAAGLTNRQIKYYLDRPEELEWVRNLWGSMNPTTAV